MTNMLLMKFELPPEELDHRFLIFRNDVSAVHFEEMWNEVFFIEESILEESVLIRNYPGDHWRAVEKHFNAFLASKKHIAVVKYTATLAASFGQVVTLLSKQKIKLHCFSFFHNDEDTESLGLDWGKNVLERKLYTIDALNKYSPYVEKVEVPPDLWMDWSHLAPLIGAKAVRANANNPGGGKKEQV